MNDDDIEVIAEAQRQAQTPEAIAEHRAHVLYEWQRDARRWGWDDQCPVCGQWIGHFVGSVDRQPCSRIPLNVLLEDVRPGCVAVRRPRIGDAIRAACNRRTS